MYKINVKCTVKKWHPLHTSCSKNLTIRVQYFAVFFLYRNKKINNNYLSVAVVFAVSVFLPGKNISKKKKNRLIRNSE